MGAPLIGQTLAFLANPFRFLEARQARYGNVFKSNVFGRRIVFLSGVEGAEAFYDPENITRSKAHPFPLVDLFGGINMEMYDGPKHFALKSIALGAFDRAALAAYLPDMQRAIEAALDPLSRADEFSATAHLRRLAIEAICSNVMGRASDTVAASLTRDYATLLAGLVSIPLPVPGTPYGRARAARNRLLAHIGQVVRERRAHPSGDALSRILAGRSPSPDGRTYTDAEAVLEVHHVVIAGFIVYAHMAEIMRQLAQLPALRDRCLEEVRAHAPSGPLSLEALAKMRVATNVVLETKRYVPLVPLAFGRAQRSFACGGFRVPEGWTVYLALSLNNKDPKIYSHPDRFDPDRFSAERAEHRRHPMAFIPQGAEPATGHRCLGLDYSTVLCTAFLALLVRGYEWELPPQDLTYNWKTLPPEPRDGLRVRMRPKAGSAPVNNISGTRN